MISKLFKLTLITVVVCTLSACSKNTFAAAETSIAKNGKVVLPVVVPVNASSDTKKMAQTLAEYLGKISGAKFQVKIGDGKAGLAVGTAADFPALNLANEFHTNDLTQREEYIVRSTPNGVLLIGVSDLAVQDAVWDFLYHLGYRQFFPGAAWEIIPSEKNISLAIDIKEKPDYLSRRIWFTYGTWPDNAKRMNEWSIKNRTVPGIILNTGHAYGGIITRNKAEFDAHPEYFTELDGKRMVGAQGKFDISNPGLRQLVVNDALHFFEQNPTADSYSVDPSDGGGWGNSPAEQALGSVSDRVTFLANVVADAVNKKFPGKYIGFYAYNDHSPPPNIKVHPNVVVSVATAFVKGGYTVDQLMEGWQKQGATIGIREYYSIIHWDKDLPGKARASNPNYIATTIPHFYEKGARFMSAESSDNWGPNGLGYYLASRYLWDVNAVKHQDALIEDFLDKSFGPAKEPMREYYGLINGIDKAPKYLLSTDFVGRMYRALEAAYTKTNDAAIRARLDDLALYTHYIELYLKYSSSTGEARQASYENLIKFAWRIRDTDMLHSLAIYRTGLRDRRVKIPADADWKVPEKDKKTGKPLNPWKQSVPFTPAEVQMLVKNGVSNNKLIDFELKKFSDNLVPATPLHLTSGKQGSFNFLRGNQDFYTWVDHVPATLGLQVHTGLSYTSRGAATVNLYSVTPTENEESKPLTHREVSPTPDDQAIQLKSNVQGLNRINISDKMAGTRIKWPDGMPMTVEASLDTPTHFEGRWTMYFYVPKGTKIVGGYRNTHVGGVNTPDGKVAITFKDENNPGYWSVPVAPGQDGKLWQLSQVAGDIMLMTVPPYVARSAEELLLPKEVVEADK